MSAEMHSADLMRLVADAAARDLPSQAARDRIGAKVEESVAEASRPHVCTECHSHRWELVADYVDTDGAA